MDELAFIDIPFPVRVSDVPKFKKKNKQHAHKMFRCHNCLHGFTKKYFTRQTYPILSSPRSLEDGNARRRQPMV